MTRQVIGVGAAANDGTGDTLRDAFTKVNAMTAELYGQWPNQPGVVSSNPSPGAGDVRYRNPLATDDASKGYAVGDLWMNLTLNVLKRCSDATTGAAVWDTVTPTELPYDALVTAGGAAQGVYGMIKMRAAYSGPCIRVRRDNDKTEQDIGFDANGVVDVAALITFLGTVTPPFIGPSLGSIKTWYDQTAGANHAVAPTETATAQWPRIHVEQKTGKAPSVFFEGRTGNGQYEKLNNYLLLPAGITATQTSGTLFVLGRATAINRTAAFGQIGVTATSASIAFQSFNGSTDYAVRLNGSASIMGTRLPLQNAVVGGIVAASGASNSKLYYDGSITSGTLTGTTACVGGYLGAVGTAAATRGNVELGCAMAASTAWTQAQWDAAERAAVFLFGITPQVRDVLTLDGDSFIDGAVAGFGRNIGRRLEAGLTARPFRVYNTGVSGDRLYNRNTRYPQMAGLVVQTGATNVFVSQAGTNDIAFLVQWRPGINMSLASTATYYYNFGKLYGATTGGVAAYDTGPTTTGTGIVSGAAVMDYLASSPESIIYARLVTLLDLARASGYNKTLVVTCHPRVDRDQYMMTAAANLVALQRANAAAADGIIDTAGDAILNNLLDRSLFDKDGVHPYDGGYDRFARIYAYKINQVAPAV